MGATTWLRHGMEPALERLRTRFPALRYRKGNIFCWSPETGEIIYSNEAVGERALWSLLHETSHALLGHNSYKTDFELIRLELLAWERAKELASEMATSIDEEHIQDCLDSYRDWIYARSICPRCGNKSIQQADLRHYRCFNCHETWKVTPSRFCRAYRATKHAPSELSRMEVTPEL